MNSASDSTIDVDAKESPLRLIVGYTAMLVVAVGLFLLIRSYGESLKPAVVADHPAAASATGFTASDILRHVLFALATIIILGRGLGKLFTYIGQPRVIGEMVAGIMLGPSLLGHISPVTMNYVIPPEIMPYLGVISQIGIVLYMFLIGIELNAGLLRSQAHATVAISHASILAPFLLGAALALWLFPTLAPDGVPFTSFALFMGVAMSITAFPILARILTDRRMDKTSLGVIALSCAATDDVTAWCLLAFVIGVARSDVHTAFRTILLAFGFIIVMFVVVRPIAIRLVGTEAGPRRATRVTTRLFVAVLLSACAAEFIGIHAIFGAFLLGAVIPHDSPVAHEFTHKLQDIVKILLLPAFFAYTGMRTQIGLVSGTTEWLICGAIILAATAGKFGGTYVAAKLTGLDWRTSAALGVLMNTRGLMELIVLNIGLELGVISPELFAMMVLMALVTTMSTTPILLLLHTARDEVGAASPAPARKAAG
ncbi:MAG TPA: cation:proton antiporter [Lacipirellulaceae bacterium]|jgi:Kef-type K+ transport system membrane component KefB